MGGDAVDPDDARWRRLHPAGLVVALARSAKAFIGAIATVAVLALRELSRVDRNPRATLLGVPVALVALAAALLAALAVALAPPVVRWLTTRYVLG